MDGAALEDVAPPHGARDHQSSALRLAILSYRSTPTVGGQGVYVDYLSRALVDAGHRVDVISGPPYPDLDPRVCLVKLPSLDLYAQPHNGHMALRPRHLLRPTDAYEYFAHLSGKFVEPFTFGQRVYAYLKAHRRDYDAVLDNQTLSLGVLKVQERLRIPLATMIHHPITRDLRLALEAEPDAKRRWLIRRWYTFHKMQIRVARQLDRIICPSESAKRDIIEEFGVAPDVIEPIPLGVDSAAFWPDPLTQRLDNRLLTTASADTPLKGLHVLVDAFAQLRKSRPELELVVIGTLRDGLAKTRIAAHGLEEAIVFKSGLSREALAEEFRRTTVAVTPSLYEGFGLPAAEAMRCGAPVVVTNGGALPEVAGEAGVIAPSGDADALAEAIAGLLDDPPRRAQVAEACRRRAEAQFDWSRIAPRYEDAFRKAMARAC